MFSVVFAAYSHDPDPALSGGGFFVYFIPLILLSIPVLILYLRFLKKTSNEEEYAKIMGRERVAMNKSSGGGGLAWLIIGIILCFFASCSAVDALRTPNPVGALGGAIFALLFFIAGIPMIVKGARGKNREVQSVTGDLVECPHCAEHIRPNAKICRFCNRDVQSTITRQPCE